MRHPILGDIRRENGEGIASVAYGERPIDLRIAPDGNPFDETIDLAASVVQDLKRLDGIAKQVAASELTDDYNDGWNEYEVAQGDGTFKTVSNPKLTQEEFARKLTLNGVSVTGGMLEFFYDDEKMFWGHCIVVTSFDGLAFKDTHAEIFG